MALPTCDLLRHGTSVIVEKSPIKRLLLDYDSTLNPGQGNLPLTEERAVLLRRFLSGWRDLQLEVYVLTSSNPQVKEECLKAAGLLELFTEVLSSSMPKKYASKGDYIDKRIRSDGWKPAEQLLADDSIEAIQSIWQNADGEARGPLAHSFRLPQHSPLGLVEADLTLIDTTVKNSANAPERFVHVYSFQFQGRRMVDLSDSLEKCTLDSLPDEQRSAVLNANPPESRRQWTAGRRDFAALCLSAPSTVSTTVSQQPPSSQPSATSQPLGSQPLGAIPQSAGSTSQPPGFQPLGSTSSANSQPLGTPTSGLWGSDDSASKAAERMLANEEGSQLIRTGRRLPGPGQAKVSEETSVPSIPEDEERKDGRSKTEAEMEEMMAEVERRMEEQARAAEEATSRGFTEPPEEEPEPPRQSVCRSVQLSSSNEVSLLYEPPPRSKWKVASNFFRACHAMGAKFPGSDEQPQEAAPSGPDEQAEGSSRRRSELRKVTFSESQITGLAQEPEAHSRPPRKSTHQDVASELAELEAQIEHIAVRERARSEMTEDLSTQLRKSSARTSTVRKVTFSDSEVTTLLIETPPSQSSAPSQQPPGGWSAGSQRTSVFHLLEMGEEPEAPPCDADLNPEQNIQPEHNLGRSRTVSEVRRMEFSNSSSTSTIIELQSSAPFIPPTQYGNVQYTADFDTTELQSALARLETSVDFISCLTDGELEADVATMPVCYDNSGLAAAIARLENTTACFVAAGLSGVDT